MLAVVGALVFTQYWYWFPLAHCLALAFTPTCVVALNQQLKMPKMDIKSNAKPSVYAYPAALEEKKREEREKVTTAVLSIAARARRREHERRQRDNATETTSIKMEVDEDEKKSTSTVATSSTTSSTTPSITSSGAPSAGQDDKKKSGTAAAASVPAVEEKKDPEPNFEILNNPARVMRQQLKVINVADNSPYVAVKDLSIGGIVMVRHTKPGEEELVEPVAGKDS